ncbi:MAG: hypothetical protein LBE15_01095, partial [Burkholderiales bacterium]|nr:hypothetical protein [Burkholderiales bacterium]
MAETLHSPASAITSEKRGSGFWSLAWQRFRDDRVGVVSLVIVAAFFVVVLLSALGVIASGWNEEAAVPDAPPDLWGLLKPAPPMVMGSAAQRIAQTAEKEQRMEALLPSAVIDPLAETLTRLEETLPRLRGEGDALPESRVVDPLAGVLQTLGADDQALTTVKEKRTSLPFGGDRWGRDVLTKTIKGSQTSIIV